MSIRSWISLAASALLSASLLAAPPHGPGVSPPADNPSPPPRQPKKDPPPNPGRPVPPDRPTRPPDRPDNIGETYIGTLVSAGAGKIVVTGADGKERVHTMSATAEILCSSRKCQLSDLRKGMTVEVTTRPADPKVAVRVIARITKGS